MCFLWASLIGSPLAVQRLFWWLQGRPQLLELPTDVLMNILLKVASHSFKDLAVCESLCTTLRDVVRSSAFYRSVDLFDMAGVWANSESIISFNRQCLANGNASGFFMVGAYDFFCKGEQEGLVKMHVAADKGYGLAIYAVTFIERIMAPVVCASCQGRRLERIAVEKERRKVEVCSSSAWSNIFPAEYASKVGALDGYNREIQRCGCQAGNGWGEMGGQLCDGCFWKRETLTFHNLFPKRVVGLRLEHIGE